MTQRILPTKTGHWWASVDDGPPMPLAVLGNGRNHSLLMTYVGTISMPLGSSRLRWIAPIPGPTVCTALAQYVESLAMVDSRTGGMSSEEIMAHFRASDGLDEAMRAVRGGA